MSRPPKLSDEQIHQRAFALPSWQVKDNTIEREFQTANFVSALGFVNAVGILAEIADHHPNIFLHGWNKVRITLSTHDKGGLTELDFELAQKIDAIKF